MPAEDGGSLEYPEVHDLAPCRRRTDEDIAWLRDEHDPAIAEPIDRRRWPRLLLAEALDLAARTWRNYETAVAIPATVIVRFIEIREASPPLTPDREGESFPERHWPGVPASSIAARGD